MFLIINFIYLIFLFMLKKVILFLVINLIFFSITTFWDYQELKIIDKNKIEWLQLNSCEIINNSWEYICYAYKDKLFYIIKNWEVISSWLNSLISNDWDKNDFKYSNDWSKVFYIWINEKENTDEYFINSNQIEWYESIQNFKFLNNNDYIFTWFSKEKQKWELVKNWKIIDEDVMIFFTQKDNNDKIIYIKNNSQNWNIEIINWDKKETINNLWDIIKQKINWFNFEEFDTSKFQILLIFENKNWTLDYLINVQNYFLYISNWEIFNSLETNIQNIDYSKKLAIDYLNYFAGNTKEILYSWNEDNLNCIAWYIWTKKIKECSNNWFTTEDLISSPDLKKYYYIEWNNDGNKYQKRVIENWWNSISKWYDNIKWWAEENSLWKKSYWLTFSLKWNNLFFIWEKDWKEVLVKNNKEISEYFNEIEKLNISPDWESYSILITDENWNEKLLKDWIEIKLENEKLEDFWYDEDWNLFIELKDLKWNYYLKTFLKDWNEIINNNYKNIIKSKDNLYLISEVINWKKEIKIIKDDSNIKKNEITPLDEKINKLSKSIKQKYSKKQIEKLIIQIDNLINKINDKNKIEIEILNKLKSAIS